MASEHGHGHPRIWWVRTSIGGHMVAWLYGHEVGLTQDIPMHRCNGPGQHGSKLVLTYIC